MGAICACSMTSGVDTSSHPIAVSNVTMTRPGTVYQLYIGADYVVPNSQVSIYTVVVIKLSSLPQKLEPKNFDICLVSRRLRDLIANIFWTKHDTNNRAKRWKYGGLPTLSKISWTLVHKRLKIRPEFLLTLNIMFRPQSIAHAVSGINVALHGESKWIGTGLICSSDSKPQKDFNLTMSGGLKWQHIVNFIAIFLVLHGFMQIVCNFSRNPENQTETGCGDYIISMTDVIILLSYCTPTKVDNWGRFHRRQRVKNGIIVNWNTCTHIQRLKASRILVDRMSRLQQSARYTPCLKKTLQNCFCQNFVKFTPILIIFGTKVVKRLKLCKVHAFSTSPNSRHHTTVLNANVPNCYVTL